MPECLHCEINDLIEERMREEGADPAELASMMAESLVDLVLSMKEEEQAKLMAFALAQLGQLYLEKSGGEAGSSATH